MKHESRINLRSWYNLIFKLRCFPWENWKKEMCKKIQKVSKGSTLGVRITLRRGNRFTRLRLNIAACLAAVDKPAIHVSLGEHQKKGRSKKFTMPRSLDIRPREVASCLLARTHLSSTFTCPLLENTRPPLSTGVPTPFRESRAVLWKILRCGKPRLRRNYKEASPRASSVPEKVALNILSLFQSFSTMRR